MVASTNARLTTRRFQVLRLAVEIHSRESEVIDAAEFLDHHARQPSPPDVLVSFTVERSGGDYVVRADDIVLDRAPNAVAVMEALFTHVQTRALALFPYDALVRGAVLRDAGKRVLLVGEPGCGLTSLAVRMLHAGAHAEGDAFALLSESGIVPVPRRFMLRPGTPKLLPELAASLPSLPRAPSGGDVVWGYDPARAGFEWEVRVGPIDACVAVEASHGAESRLLPITVTETVRRVVARCSPPPAGGAGWLRDVIALLERAACSRLVLGRLEEAVPMVRRAWADQRRT